MFDGNTPWLIGLVGAIAFFIVWETLAFVYPHRFNTLSHAVNEIGSNFPLSIWFMGIFCGGLAVHFFWHWCPDMGQGVGMISIPQMDAMLGIVR